MNFWTKTTIGILLSIVLDLALAGTPDPKIRKELLKNYDSLAQPYPSLTTVTIPYISVIHYDIDDQMQTFEVHAWIVMSWMDRRLKWTNFSRNDPTGYVHFSTKEIWTPEIATYNTAKPTVMNDFAQDAQILVQNDGTVLWVPPVRFITNCKMNLVKWPFDRQKCSIKIGSWTFNENEIDLQFGSPDNEHEDENGNENESLNGRIKTSYEGLSFPNNTQWRIEETSAVRTAKKYSCCIERYVDITFYFTLKRKYSTFIYTLILPVFMISIVSLGIFIFPLHGNSRIILSAFNFMVIGAYMIYFRMRLPTIDHVPAIVKFFTWNLFVTTFAIIQTAVLTNLIIGNRNRKIPGWAKMVLDSKFVKMITLRKEIESSSKRETMKSRASVHGKKVMGENEGFLEEIEGNDLSGNKFKRSDWIALIDLVDKCAVAFFGFITFIMIITLLS